MISRLLLQLPFYELPHEASDNLPLTARYTARHLKLARSRRGTYRDGGVATEQVPES